MASSVQKADGVSVTLRSVPAVTAPAGTFSLTLNVRNLSGRSLTFDLPNAQAYDFLSFEKGGQEVWRWSEGMVFTQAVTTVKIASAESLVFKVAWQTGGLPPGLYTVQGYFAGMPAVRPSLTVELADEGN